MAVLDKDSFLNRIHTIVGDDSSDDNIAFLEDMADTYNALEKKANGDGIDWEKKYHENDEAWKKRYRHRFMSAGGGTPDERRMTQPNEDKDPESVSFDDLFSTK